MGRRHPLTALVLAVFRTHQALVTAGDRRVADLDLNSARWKVLGAIELGEAPLTAPEIGRRMGLSRQGAQKQLDALAHEGLVEARENPARRRVPLWVTTTRGRRAFERADAVWSGWVTQLAKGLEPARIRDAAALLAALADRIDGEEAAS